LCDTFQRSGERNGRNVKDNGDLYTDDMIKKTDDRDIVRVRLLRLVGQADGRIAQERSRKERGSSAASYAVITSTGHS
jgi:hypothetical protein